MILNKVLERITKAGYLLVAQKQYCDNRIKHGNTKYRLCHA
jgi:hypothetical protein